MNLRHRALLTGVSLVAGSLAVGVADARAPHPAGTEVATVTVLSSSANPALFGPVTFTATVSTAVGGSPADAGSVTFTLGSIPLATIDVGSDGVAVHSTGSLAPGAHSITASYGGVQNRFSPSADSLTQQIDLRPTTTTLTDVPDSARFGESVTFTATVVDTATDTELDNGTVAFSVNGATVATEPVSGGVASFTTDALTIGGHGIRATYNPVPGGVFAGSEVVMSYQVFQPATNTSLTSTSNPSLVNHSVTFTATVTSGGNAVTTGSVHFSAGQLDLGTVAVDAGGVASVSTSTLDIGQHQIFAIYATNASFSSSSASLDQTVAALRTTTVLESSRNPSAVGEPVTFTARVFFNGTVPDGLVDFFDGGTAMGSVDLDSNGIASLTTSELPAGDHQIVARYSGSATFAPSTSAELSQRIDGPVTTSTPQGGSTTTSEPSPSGPTTTEPPPSGPTTTEPASTSTSTTVPTSSTPGSGDRATTTVITSSANPSVEGQPVTFAVTVSASASGPIGFRRPAGAPAPDGGSVTITAGVTVLAIVGVVDGRVAFTTSSLGVGAHTITAAFSGTDSTAPSMATIVQRVDPTGDLPSTR
jgi:hypothetical protein